ncbi:MAG TPA: methyltransferase [Gemmatimonas sp.]|uniref:methyltransferase n=1 Tax=Gemmatimonas sp. TaxID=1962908 RepID=UPI002ED936BD
MPSEMLPDRDLIGDALPAVDGASAPERPSDYASALPQLDAADADFAALRALFAAHRYDESNICARTEIPAIYDFACRTHVRGNTPPEHGLDALIWVFLDCQSMHPDQMDRLLGADSAALLQRLGLLEPDGEQVVGTVLLYPTAGVYLISDRPTFSVAGITLKERATDLVYPAITSSVRVFVSTLPAAAGTRHLELCSGTGIAALDAVRRGATHAWAIDITARSTHFAAFNARMNGFDNVTALQGDLYAPVAGMQFDVISAHPPYVPSMSTEFIYRDGGEDGEQISRAIIRGLPEFLAPGGIFHCTCTVTARKGKAVPHRLREVLGQASDEFDLVLLGNGTSDFSRHFTKELLKANAAGVPGVVAQIRRFHELEVERMEFCTIVLRRHGQPRKGATIAVERDGTTRWEEVAWLLGLQDLLGEGERALPRLLEVRPRLSSGARFSLTYTASPGSEEVWTPTEGQVAVSYPFSGRVVVSAGDAAFLASCTGDRTFGRILRDLQDEGSLPSDLPPTQFLRTMVPLIAEGVLETDILPFPTRSSTQ